MVYPPSISTLKELKESGYTPLTVKEEIAKNVAKHIESQEPIFPKLFGYEETVIPQLIDALLAGHDIILLGERGQAKTRIARSLINLLDKWIPVIKGSDVNDDPLSPISLYGKNLVKELGDDTPVSWIQRSERLNEKLATPDTSVADLIGDVDPIKIAEGRYLSDESAINFGLIPRSNRKIFIINELPDLAERIQVGLFNILEERDIQIRNFTVRLPLDIMLVASANPEDYTNRGRIITPLKDRFGAQIRTHYPSDVQTEATIVRSEARIVISELARKTPVSLPEIKVPDFMLEIICTMSNLARLSPQVNQKSGVSVRLSINNYETLVATSLRRAIALREPIACPRVSDLDSLSDSTLSKIELDTFEEEGAEQFLASLIRASILEVFKGKFKPEDLTQVVNEFENGLSVETGADLAANSYTKVANSPSISAAVKKLSDSASAPAIASCIEFILEGLHVSKRLNKDVLYGRSIFRARQKPRVI